jgi:hypothetical protein
MNSSPDFQTPRQTSFFATPETPGELLFSLTIPGRLPSWNEILGMEQWARYNHKKELAGAFLCALRATANDSSTKTTSAKSTMLTYADTLERYLATKQAERKSRSAKKKLEAKNLKGSSSKSTDFGKVPF